jgi:hypothetical protein
LAALREPVFLGFTQNEVLRAPRPLQIWCSHFKKSAKIPFLKKMRESVTGVNVSLIRLKQRIISSKPSPSNPSLSDPSFLSPGLFD